MTSTEVDKFDIDIDSIPPGQSHNARPQDIKPRDTNGFLYQLLPSRIHNLYTVSEAQNLILMGWTRPIFRHIKSRKDLSALRGHYRHHWMRCKCRVFW